MSVRNRAAISTPVFRRLKRLRRSTSARMRLGLSRREFSSASNAPTANSEESHSTPRLTRLRSFAGCTNYGFISGFTDTLPRFDGSDAFRAVVRRAVDRARHRDRFQLVRIIRPQQSRQFVRFTLRIDPRRFVIGVEDRGHPVMNLRDQFIRFDRDDRAGFERVALWSSPFLPESCESEQSAVAPADVDRLARRLAALPPFIKTVGRNQATPPGESLFEGGFFGNRLGLGVDQIVSDLRVFGPEGNQPPFATGHLAQLVARSGASNHRNDLRRRDVVTRREEFLDRLHVEPLFDLFGFVMKCVSSAHIYASPHSS